MLLAPRSLLESRSRFGRSNPALPFFTGARPPCERTRRYNRPTMPAVTPELVFHGARQAEVRLSFVSRTSLRLNAPCREVRLSEKPDFVKD